MTKSKSKEYKPVKPVLGTVSKSIECICDRPLLDGGVCFKCGRPVRERRAA